MNHGAALRAPFAKALALARTRDYVHGTTLIASLGEVAFRGPMCRNIKTLFNFDPPASDEEVRAAALQFVRKLSGFTAPSKTNQAAFERAVAETAKVAQRLLDSLVTTSAARNREEEAAKAKARSRERFGPKAARASF